MPNKILNFCVIFIIVFFAWTHFAHAGFEITEIMYDLDGTDTNREWVEVQNTGSASADLSTWFFFSDNTKHALVPQGASLVPLGGYAIIAQNATNFRTDWPNFSGLLFDSSWTGFNNDGETIAMKDPDLNLVGSVTFTSSQGGAGDGNSTQKIGSVFSGATPTPGAVNQVFSGGGDENSSPEITTSTSKKKEIEVPKITTNIITNNTVFAGIPFEITTTTLGYSKEPLRMGRFVWNFGDGTTKTEYEHLSFEHVYQYSGEYVITLSYYRAWTGTVLEATDRIIIKVIPSGVAISSVGKEGDPYVEIENKAIFEVDLSNWIIQGAVQVFVIPEGTIILPNQKLRFSGKATSLTSVDVQSITLQNTNREIASTYPTVKTIARSPSGSRSYSSASDSAQTTSSVINLSDLGASVADVRSTRLPRSFYAWVGLAGVILIGLTSVYLTRKRNTESDDIDKSIRAEDMMIIE